MTATVVAPEKMFHGEMTVRIGTWHEREARTVNRCPSYYAADHETLQTVPGDYPLNLRIVGGYTVPMPYWLLVSVPADRTDGRLYSGFGGVNFASTELPRERTTYTVQMYAYQLAELVAAGKVTVDAPFAGLVDDRIEWARGFDDYAAIRALATPSAGRAGEGC